jgi:hypothetical protein
MGIEPTSEAWEASILPLYDARSWQAAQLGTKTIIHKPPIVSRSSRYPCAAFRASAES